MPRVRQRRTRHQRERLLLTALACSTGFFALATVVVGYFVWSIDSVERLAVAGSLTQATEAPVSAQDIVAAEAEPDGVALATADPERFEQLAIHRPDRPAENYLLVGTDSIEGISAGDVILTDREEEAGNHLADTLMILRLRPDGTAAVVSIPRDLLVTIAGTGRTAKVNSAFNLADPAARATRLIDTVEEHLGIDLQHFIEIDLDGFRRLVDAVGGVEVCFEQPIRDRTTDDSGDLNRGGTGFVAAAGAQVLDGQQALQYVRSRHLYIQDEDGDWTRLGFWNDIERNGRQQQFVFDAVDQALADALSSPSTVRSMLDIVANNVTTSDTISLFDDGLDLARLFRSFDADTQLERYAFDLLDTTLGGQAGLALAGSAHNDRVRDVFQGVGWADVVAERVVVEVVGDRVSDAVRSLDALGFAATPGTGESADRSAIRYGVGGQFAAALVASHLPPSVEFVGDPSLAGNQIVLELGAIAPPISSEHRIVTLPTPIEVPADGDAAPVPAVAVPPAVEVAGVCDPR